MYMLVIYLCADEVLSVCARVCDETETQIKKKNVCGLFYVFILIWLLVLE